MIWKIVTLVLIVLNSCTNGEEDHSHHGHEKAMDGRGYAVNGDEVVVLRWRKHPHDDIASIHAGLSLNLGACTMEKLTELVEHAEHEFEQENASFPLMTPYVIISVEAEEDGDEHHDGEGFVELWPDELVYESLFRFYVNQTSTDGSVCLFLVLPQPVDGIETNLLRVDGTEIKPSITTSGEETPHREEWQIWVEAIGATLVTCLCSLVGILAIVPWLHSYNGPSSWFSFVIGNVLEANAKKFDRIMRRMLSFGVGTLITAIFLHIFPESLHLIETSETMESHLGPVLFITGIFSALIVESIVSAAYGSNSRNYMDSVFEENEIHTSRSASGSLSIMDQVEQQQQEPQSVSMMKKTKTTKLMVSPTAYNVIIGDAFHNLSDGILLAAAFSSCNSALGWTLCLAIVAHEVPQEFVDFVILLQSGLSVRAALGFNLLASLSALLGAICVLAAGEVEPAIQGCLIAYGSGVLAFLALAEMTPMIMREKDIKEQLLRIFLILVGSSVIGLLQLFHPHCELEGHDAHEDH